MNEPENFENSEEVKPEAAEAQKAASADPVSLAAAKVAAEAAREASRETANP